jgi:protein-disulfide isomerase
MIIITRNRSSRLFPGLGLLILFCVQHTFGQQPSSEELKILKRDVQTLRENQAEIEKQVKEIRDLVQAQGAVAAAPEPLQPKDIVLSIDDDPLKGNRNAPMVLIEFGDFQCPFCARYFRETLPQIEENYIKTGKLKYVFRDFPITGAHKDALKAAEAMGCALDQNKFWELHDRLFVNQTTLEPSNLVQHAQAIGLDVSKFKQCLESEKYLEEIRKDFADGRTAGVFSTPTFFLGRTEPKSSKVTVLAVITGAKPYDTFKAAIDSALSSQKSATQPTTAEGQSDQISAIRTKTIKQKAQAQGTKRNSQRKPANHQRRVSKSKNPRNEKSCDKSTSKGPLFCAQ